MILLRVLLLLLCFPVRSQSIDQILSEHFTRCGQIHWSEINTVEIAGKWSTDDFQKFPIRITLKQSKIRFDGVWKGSRFIEVSTGKSGWQLAPWTKSSGPIGMTAFQAMATRQIFTLGSPLFEVKDKLVLLGLANWQNELHIHLQYQTEEAIFDYYLGQKDFGLYGEVITTKAETPEMITKQYEKYRDYSGLLAPTSVRIKSGDMERELIFEHIVLGIGVNDSFFEFPKTDKQ
jgi:hypothetical protein